MWKPKVNIFHDMITQYYESDTELRQWNILSDFFHRCLDSEYTDKRILIQYMQELDSRLLTMENEELKCVISALVEYTFLECNEEPPSWVNLPDFTFSKDPSEWFKVRIFKRMTSDVTSIIESSMQDRSDIFVKRNLPRHGFYNAV